MKAQRIGHIDLPRGLVSKARDARPRYWQNRLRNWEALDLPVQEIDGAQALADAVFERVLRDLGAPLPRTRHEDSFVWYRSVSRHTDDWLKHRFDGLPRAVAVAVAFLHVCVQGTTRLRVKGETLTLNKGDVFLLNPNTYHEVISTTLCGTVSFVVPLKLATALVAQKDAHAPQL